MDKSTGVMTALKGRKNIGPKKEATSAGIVKKLSDNRTAAKDTAKPADLAAAQHGPGTSTSTGGATATRNTGAATGGAVTITISGSSSTGTSTETSTETATATGGTAGKGGSKGKGAGKTDGKIPDTGDKRPHVYNITVNSTGQSGHAVDGGAAKKGVDAKKGLLKNIIKKNTSGGGGSKP